MKDPLYNHLRELSWRRKLTEAEEAQLRTILSARPEAQADWESEIRLNRFLDQVLDVPVASNFTNRVLQAAEREATGRSRSAVSEWKSLWPSLGWMPKTAIAAALLCLVLSGYYQYRSAMRAQMAQSLPEVSSVVSLSSLEIWENFQAINQLNRTPPQADRELLALMK